MRQYSCFLFLVLAAGCSAQGTFVKTSDVQTTQKPASAKIEVFTGKPDRPYTEIGLITVRKEATTIFARVDPDELMPKLIEEARKAGADAVINVSFEDMNVGGRNVHGLMGKATAVIWK